MIPSRISIDEFTALLAAGMPSSKTLPCEVASLAHGHAVLVFDAGARTLRPGGTVSGPALFGYADLAMYAAVLSAVGLLPLSVTTDATVHFLRKPPPGRLRATARVLKQGKRLVVGDVVIVSEADPDQPVVHAVMTYSVPAS